MIPSTLHVTHDSSVKEIIFAILCEEYPKTASQLQADIRKKYRKSVTFQAVLKALKEFVTQSIVIKTEKQYTLNKQWILQTNAFFSKLTSKHASDQSAFKRVEIGTHVTVYTIKNLYEVDRLWNELLMSWATTEKDDKRNVWKGKHCWWLIPRLHEEDVLQDYLDSQQTKTFNIIQSGTPMDKKAAAYYTNRGHKCKIISERVEKELHIAAFGEFFLKFELPSELSYHLDQLYKKRIEDIDLAYTSQIFKKEYFIEVTVIKDKAIADKFKENIISELKDH